MLLEFGNVNLKVTSQRMCRLRRMENLDREGLGGGQGTNSMLLDPWDGTVVKSIGPGLESHSVLLQPCNFQPHY